MRQKKDSAERRNEAKAQAAAMRVDAPPIESLKRKRVSLVKNELNADLGGTAADTSTVW